MDGRTVRTASGEVTLATRVATSQAEADEGTVEMRFEEPGRARVLHAVSTPSMVYFLLVLGLAALAFELTQPGFGFAGFAGVFLTALAIYGLTVAVPSGSASPCCCSGSDSLMLDVRLRALSWPTWAGLVAFGVGSVLAWRGVDASIRISPWLIGGAVLGSALYYGFALTVALQSRDRIVGAQRVDRAGRRGPRTPRAGRAGVREGRALARPDERRPDRGRHARPGPGCRRPDPAGGGRTGRARRNVGV